MGLTLSAPAKINWFLHITGKRSDGYHDISSAMQSVSLFDSLTFSKAGDIELVSDMGLPAAENLVYKAASLLRQRTAYSGGAQIVLKKEIPLAAGLGGGSSDAASTLMGLNTLWELGLGIEYLKDLAAEIGSDVTFFLDGPFSLAEGRGEKIKRMQVRSHAILLLVKPAISVSTAWAYSMIKTELTKKDIDIKLLCQFLDERDYPSLRNMITNDLERPVLQEYPVVAEIKEMLLENGAIVSLMSGSGPTVFGVFESDAAAVKASVRLSAHWCKVVRTLV